MRSKPIMAKLSLRKCKNFITNKDESVGMVMIGTDHQPLCVIGHTTSTVPGKNHILIVNSCIDYRQMPTTIYHQMLWATAAISPQRLVKCWLPKSIPQIKTIRIWQPLLAANIYKGELHLWQYYTHLNREGNNVKTGFQLVVPLGVESYLQSDQVEAQIYLKLSDSQENLHLTFGHHPDMR